MSFRSLLMQTHVFQGSERVQQAAGSLLRLLSRCFSLGHGLHGSLDGGWCHFTRAQQWVMRELGVAGSGRRLLTVHAAGERMRLAAGPGARGRRDRGPAVAWISIHGGGNEVGTGAGQPPLQVVGLRAAESGGRAEIAQVVSTGGYGVFAVLHR